MNDTQQCNSLIYDSQHSNTQQNNIQQGSMWTYAQQNILLLEQ